MCSLRVLKCLTTVPHPWPLLASTEAVAAQEAAQTFVLCTLALMAEVVLNTRSSLIEVAFIGCLACVVDPANRVQMRDMVTAQFYDELVAAWNAPALQSELRTRGTLDHIEAGMISTTFAALHAIKAADVAAFGLHACALPACGAREVTVHQFKRCGGCKAVVYCSAACSKAHWKAGHKRECSRCALPAQPNQQ